MSAEFVDTNIFIYTLDLGAAAKHQKAKALVARLFATHQGAISTQVLAEIYSTATRKLRLTSQEVRETIDDLDRWTLHQPSHSSILTAIDLKERYRISWWDALILNTQRSWDAPSSGPRTCPPGSSTAL